MSENTLGTDRRPQVRVALGLALVLLCGMAGVLIGAVLPIEAFWQP